MIPLWATRAAALTVVAAAIGCSGPDPGPSETVPEARQSKAESPSAPRPTRPPPGSLAVEVRGGEKEELQRAIEELRAIGLWTKLTIELDRLRLIARATEMPGDDHLAESQVTIARGAGVRVRACRIELFEEAIEADLERQSAYHDAGRLPEPPTYGDFLVALLAHELAHCLPGEPGEKVALRWERRALARAQR